MRYLLDSDTLSDLYEQHSPGHPKVAARLAALADLDEVCVSILTLYEYEYGHAHAPAALQSVIRERIEDLQRNFALLPLTAAAARLYGQLKEALTRARGLGKRAGKAHNIDLMIAAAAIEEGCILVSADSLYSELEELVIDLKVADWLTDEA